MGGSNDVLHFNTCQNPPTGRHSAVVWLCSGSATQDPTLKNVPLWRRGECDIQRLYRTGSNE